ncbi:unnamed protein product [Blepharisma stoltei]|uniref:Uncharacterized protein n=1 Tax=Blepharisma stoltei TaxID=1481888 RepID=A0AAU9J4C4_9CILI|nr:unnamed protein product [Blepharisma stoltei]
MNSNNKRLAKPGFISRIIVWWLYPLAWNSVKESKKDEKYLQPILEGLRPDENSKKLQKAWENEMSLKNPSFMRALFKAFGYDYLKIGIPFTISLFGNLGISILLSKIIDYFENEEAGLWVAAVYSILLLIVSVIAFIQNERGYLESMLLGIKIESSISLLLYENTLAFSANSLGPKSSQGKIVNLVSSDIENFRNLSMTVSIWVFPIYFIAAMVTIAFFLGWAGVIGLTLVLFSFPMQMFLSRMTSRKLNKTSKYIDSRINLISNIFDGIRIIKLYGWEVPFMNMISLIRGYEISEYWKSTILKIFAYGVNISGQGIIILITFALYIRISGPLEYSNIYCGMSILMISYSYMTGNVALGMLQRGLYISTCNRTKEALMSQHVKKYPHQENAIGAISFREVNSSWAPMPETAPDPKLTHGFVSTLDNIDESLGGYNFTVEPGELCAVIGSVGSGKTKLLHTILGETFIYGGEIKMGGSLAYVEQEPWIIAGTVKDNILMSEPYEQSKYESVLKCCCLEEDVNAMSNGDNTHVGEHGCNLSGGQRARISLARAVYADKDIYLLDDPFSAVDARVAENILKVCIKGRLKRKTIIMVTNQLYYLPFCSKILLVDNGKIIFEGNYDKLRHEEWALEMIGKNGENNQDDRTNYQIKDMKEVAKDPASKSQDETQSDEEEDTISSKAVKLRVYFQFLKAGFRSFCVLLIFLSICAVAQTVYIIMQYWITYWCSKSDGEQKKAFYPLVLLVATLCVFFTAFCQGAFIINVLLYASKLLHNTVFARLLFAPITFYDENPGGKLLNIFSRDIFIVDAFVSAGLSDSLRMFLIIFALLVTTVYIVPYSLIVIVIYLSFFYMVHVLLIKRIRYLKQLDLSSRNPVNEWFGITFDGLRTIRCYNFHGYFKNAAISKVTQALQVSFNFIINSRCLILSGSTCVGVCLGLNALIIVAFVDKSNASLASLSLSFTSTIMQLLPYLIRTIVDTEIYMSSTERVNQFRNIYPEEDSETKSLNITEGKIEFKDVTMRYNEHSEFILKGVSFEIEGGKRYGVIGRTGSGKSTLFQVLFRLYHMQDGAIYIDGQDINTVSLASLRKNMSIIPQIPFIFTETLRNNLDPLHEHTDEDLLDALDSVSLSYYFQCFNGLDTQLASNFSISAGQKQLICLARAILRQNKILVIDEATAFTDGQTDELIQNIISEKFKGSTVLTIAHRLSTIINYDGIILIDGGEIMKIGKPDEMIEKRRITMREMTKKGRSDIEFALRPQYESMTCSRLTLSSIQETPMSLTPIAPQPASPISHVVKKNAAFSEYTAYRGLTYKRIQSRGEGDTTFLKSQYESITGSIRSSIRRFESINIL